MRCEDAEEDMVGQLAALPICGVEVRWIRQGNEGWEWNMGERWSPLYKLCYTFCRMFCPSIVVIREKVRECCENIVEQRRFGVSRGSIVMYPDSDHFYLFRSSPVPSPPVKHPKHLGICKPYTLPPVHVFPYPILLPLTRQPSAHVDHPPAVQSSVCHCRPSLTASVHVDSTNRSTSPGHSPGSR